MEHSYPSKLQVWAGWTPVPRLESLPALNLPPLGSDHPPAAVDRLYAAEILSSRISAVAATEGAEPYSLQWFLDIEQQRYGRPGRWLPRLLEFTKHSGETLAGLGNGLGSDWVQYARHGAQVTICSSSAEQLALSRRNFELRGLTGRFHCTPFERLPLDNASIDVVCLHSLLEEVPGRPALVAEIYRVLKPGGKVLAVTPARYDVRFWTRTLMPWRRWLKPLWGHDQVTALPFSARGLRRLFGRFIEHRIHKRQLRRREVPFAWRWLPLPILERIMGRVLVLKAFKPLSAAITVPLAAA